MFAPDGLQSATEHKAKRRSAAPRPRCAISVHQPPGEGVQPNARSGDIRGHEEKRARRSLQKWGPQTWRPKGRPYEVQVHDFPSQAEGKAIPYGTYDINENCAVVNVGITHDTAEFAVESIRRWWRLDGQRRYRSATRVLICAGLRRQQQQPHTSLEVASTTTRRRNWTVNLGVSLSTWYQQMEQDRASTLFLY